MRGHAKGKTLSGGRGHLKEPYHRTTLGTGLSDKNTHTSYTIYAFMEGSFDEMDIDKLEIIFMNAIMKYLYPKKNYNQDDY